MTSKPNNRSVTPWPHLMIAPPRERETMTACPVCAQCKECKGAHMVTASRRAEIVGVDVEDM